MIFTIEYLGLYVISPLSDPIFTLHPSWVYVLFSNSPYCEKYMYVVYVSYSLSNIVMFCSIAIVSPTLVPVSVFTAVSFCIVAVWVGYCSPQFNPVVSRSVVSFPNICFLFRVSVLPSISNHTLFGSVIT